MLAFLLGFVLFFCSHSSVRTEYKYRALKTASTPRGEGIQSKTKKNMKIQAAIISIIVFLAISASAQYYPCSNTTCGTCSIPGGSVCTTCPSTSNFWYLGACYSPTNFPVPLINVYQAGAITYDGIMTIYYGDPNGFGTSQLRGCAQKTNHGCALATPDHYIHNNQAYACSPADFQCCSSYSCTSMGWYWYKWYN